MSVLPPHTVGNSTDFLKWAKTACKGEFVVYHAGSLVLDRIHDQTLNQLADTVHVFQETGFISASAKRMFLQIMDVWAYTAHRTGHGYAPTGMITRKINSSEWRSLQAIRDRDADISAIRAIRDAVSSNMTSSDEVATEIFEGLRAKKLITEAPGKGWTLTQTGIRAMT